MWRISKDRRNDCEQAAERLYRTGYEIEKDGLKNRFRNALVTIYELIALPWRILTPVPNAGAWTWQMRQLMRAQTLSGLNVLKFLTECVTEVTWEGKIWKTILISEELHNFIICSYSWTALSVVRWWTNEREFEEPGLQRHSQIFEVYLQKGHTFLPCS